MVLLQSNISSLASPLSKRPTQAHPVLCPVALVGDDRHGAIIRHSRKTQRLAGLDADIMCRRAARALLPAARALCRASASPESRRRLPRSSGASSVGVWRGAKRALFTSSVAGTHESLWHTF